MAYYTAGISNVRCTARAGNPSECVVTWESTYTAYLYQIYVNGVLAASTHNLNAPKTKTICVHTDYANLIGVLAVDPANRNTDYSSYFSANIAKGNRVTMQWPALASYGYKARVNIYNDAKTGTVDYGTPVNPQPIEVFPNGLYARGFGLGGFGYGGFGWDGANAIGFGRGAFGCGEFGFNAPLQSYKSDPVASGSWKWAVKVLDNHNNLSATASEKNVAVDAYPRSPKRLSVKTWSSPNLTLQWISSPDV